MHIHTYSSYMCVCVFTHTYMCVLSICGRVCVCVRQAEDLIYQTLQKKPT